MSPVLLFIHMQEMGELVAAALVDTAEILVVQAQLIPVVVVVEQVVLVDPVS
jgi:hypothetical protein